jgi:hypothetical protein
MDMQQDMTCSKDMGMQHGNSTLHILGHVVWTWTSSMDMDCSIEMGMQHGVEHVWRWTCILDMYVFISMSLSTVAMAF